MMTCKGITGYGNDRFLKVILVGVLRTRLMDTSAKPLWSLLANLILLLLVLTATPALAQDQDAAPATESAEPLAITHGPYLQLPGEDSMTIVWHTNRNAVSKIEYGQGDALDKTAVPSEHGLIPNDRTNHIVRLTGLQPGAAYKYRVASTEFLGYTQQHLVTFGDAVTGETHEFTTLDAEKKAFSFAVVSDIHERADDLASRIKAPVWQGIDFAFYNGDMVNDFMRIDQPFTGFIDVSVDLFAKETPFILVRGNHDVRGRHARRLAKFIPTRRGRADYSFKHGPVHVIILDKGEDKEDPPEYYNGLVDFEAYRAEQARWLARDVRSRACRNAKYRIVLSHIPPLASRGFGAQNTRENFEPFINQANADLWLSGHTHRFSRTDPKAGENVYTQVVGGARTTTRVDVTGEQLKVAVIGQEGEEIDAITLKPR
jgi:predicted phosphodiesterase